MPRAKLSQVTINYMKMGTWTAGVRPLILTHGLAASSAFWFHAAERLGPRFPVLVWDLRGHGRSTIATAGYTAGDQAGDLLELMDFLEIPEAELVGHSFGGSVVLHAAESQPGRFASLALVDTRLRIFQPDLTPAAWPKWEEQRRLLAEVGLAIDDDEPEAGISVLTALSRLTMRSDTGAPDDLPRWMMEYFGQRQSRHTAGRWLELVENSTMLQDIRQKENLDLSVLQSLPQRVLAIYGGQSPLLPSGHGLRDNRPGTEWVEVPGAGHFFPAVRPRALTDPLENFLHPAGGC